MKLSALDKLEGRADDTIMNEEYVTEFYPRLLEFGVEIILVAARNAWEELLSNCETCPSRCISERDVYSSMFDKIDISGSYRS